MCYPIHNVLNILPFESAVVKKLLLSSCGATLLMQYIITEKRSKYGRRQRTEGKSIQSSTTPDTTCESDKNTRKRHTQENLEVTLSQQVTTRLKRTDKTAWQTRHMKKINQKRSTALEWSVKSFTGGLKLVSWYQPHPYLWCGSSQIDVWFAWMIPYLYIYHLLVNTNRDINRR